MSQKNELNKPRSIIISVVGLIVFGYLLATGIHSNPSAWIYVTGFYAVWIIASLLFLVGLPDVRKMFAQIQNPVWLLAGLPFVALFILFIFIPNLHLLQANTLLLFHIVICVVNPFMEEIYWRGLVTKVSDSKWISFLFATLAFAASHPFIFGVNSHGVAGLVGFFGTFVVGSLFWLLYIKTRSLWSSVLIHFLVDVFGMAAYILSDTAKLPPVPAI